MTSTVDLTSEITSAQAKDGKDAATRIEHIITHTTHRGTALYGLRVLSRFDYEDEVLLKLAREYNSRQTTRAAESVNPHLVDRQYITHIYVVNRQDKGPELRILVL